MCSACKLIYCITEKLVVGRCRRCHHTVMVSPEKGHLKGTGRRKGVDFTTRYDLHHFHGNSQSATMIHTLSLDCETFWVVYLV